MKSANASIDMTEGSIVKNLVKFALPLLLGNMFQQLYNMVDTYVIGQTGDISAYAAVGSVGPIINILIGFFLGFSAGAGVVISQYFGAGDKDKVSTASHTAMAFSLILCVVLTAVGVIFAPFLVRLMLRGDAQSNLYYAAKDYLTIYFSGVTGLLIYNIGSGILRAIGDSRHPFIFLAVSAFTNTVLDVAFVFGLKMGVSGVALATVIAQCLSAALTLFVLFRTDTPVRIYIKKLKLNGATLIRIVRIGVPAAIQMALTSFSNVFVQSYIGSADPPAGMSYAKDLYLSGWTTYSKVDAVMFLPLQSVSVAVTTFVGQNLGRGYVARAKRGTYAAYLIQTVITIALMIPIITFAPQIAAVFNSDPEVVENASLLLHRLTPFYLFPCVNQVFAGSLRGAGRSTPPMFIMLGTFVGVRQIYLFIMSNFVSNSFLSIAFSYPVGWIVCSVTMLTFFFTCDFSKGRITGSPDYRYLQ